MRLCCGTLFLFLAFALLPAASARPWVVGDAAFGVAGVFVWISIIVTSVQIYRHLHYYNKKSEQVWIVRILFMVPIYAIASWLSLRYFEDSIYFDSVRNVYEAFVIYSFLALCYQYLGGEVAILDALTGKVCEKSWLTCNCCIAIPINLYFLRFCKQGVLQFCVVKPLMTVVIIIMATQGRYVEGDLRPDYGYLYVSLVYNLSITLSLYTLVLFYAATQSLLSPYKPVLKFLVIKSVIFLSFWQGIGLAVAEKIHVISDSSGIQAGELASAYQNFLICIEMALASVLLHYAFPVDIYMHLRQESSSSIGPDTQNGKTTTSSFKRVTTNLKDTLNPSDMIDDTIRNFAPKYSQYVNQTGSENHSFDDRSMAEEEEPNLSLIHEEPMKIEKQFLLAGHDEDE